MPLWVAAGINFYVHSNSWKNRYANYNQPRCSLEKYCAQLSKNVAVSVLNVSFSVSDPKSSLGLFFGLDKILECIGLGLGPQGLIYIPAIGNAHLHLKRVYQCWQLVSCCQQCRTDHVVPSEIELRRRRRLHVTKSQLRLANLWQVLPLTAHSS